MSDVLVLGSVQDGGVPHAGCLCANCQAARSDINRRRLPASIGVVSGDEWAIVDTTSAFEEQMHMLWRRRATSDRHEGERYRPPETVILTHAHTGHYVGLWQLDRSTMAASGTHVLVPPRTADFLMANEPWAQMVSDGFIVIEPAEPGVGFSPVAGVTVTPIEVPHRSEWPTETVCLHIQGPDRSLLYLPDIDSWDEWDHDLVTMVRGVDIAVLDGCFWDKPTSAVVPHPSIIETMERLQSLVDADDAQVIFTHINHSNPVITPDSPEAAEVERRGFEIARDGRLFSIG